MGSTTEHTGSDEPSSDYNQFEATRSLSADINGSDIDHDQNEDYMPPYRRSSAPNIKSPKEMDSGSIANKIITINDENNDRNIHDEIKLKKRKNGHSHSQSLHGADLNKMLDDIKRPRLRPSNSQKPSTSKHSKKSLKKSSVSTTNIYRGHISVKHPKRYKRKTPAEIQFNPEDIQIPAGIKYEALDSPKNNEQKEEIIDTPKQIKSEKSEQTESHSNLTQHEMEENKENKEENISNDIADICPWTTFHGGMIYEDLENNKIGNDIYFVGLIDILQKYNKRKKLENWIKKMKYDKHSISAAPPDIYAQRMCDFFEDKVV